MSVAFDTPPEEGSVLSPDERLNESLEIGALLALSHGPNLIPVSREEIACRTIPRRDCLHVRRRFVDPNSPSAPPVDILLKYSALKRNRDVNFPRQIYSLIETQSIFSAPRYYGQLTDLEKSIGASIGVWEYIPKNSTADHLFGHRAVRAAVVEAAAAMTAMGKEAGRAVSALPATPKFVKPVAERFGSLAAAADYFGLGRYVCVELLSKLAAFEQPAIAKLTELGGYLTHNDLQPENFLYKADQPLMIYDWKSVSLGAPGASLLFLGYLEETDLLRVVYRYCWHLVQMGVFLRPTDVLFALRASAIFRILNYHAFNAKVGPVTATDALVRALRSVDFLCV